MNTVLYFAYGSNMSQERLETRVGKVNKIGTDRLVDFELQFDCGTETQSFANIKSKDESFVDGVLYELTQEQLMMLDYFEGAGWPEYYQRITERTESGKFCYVYISFNRRENLSIMPAKDYIDTLNQGYLENNIDQKINLQNFGSGKMYE